MQPILDLGIRIIIFLQSMGDWHVLPMTALSFLGNEQFFLIVAPVIYWCIDASLGFRLGIYLMISAGLNDVFKILCHAPRPYWIDTHVKAFSVETSFGIPSGHSMNSTTIWGTVAATLKKRGIWIGAAALIFLIGLSRLYLGMHFPTDVLAGWFLGALLLIIIYWIEKPLVRWIKANTNPQKIALAFILSLSIIALGFFGRIILEGWEIPATWIENAAFATKVAEPINPVDPKGLISSCGALFGLALGYILLDMHGGFQVAGSLWQKITRFFIGLVGILIFWKVLGMFLPDESTFLSFALRYFRYTLIGVWVTGGAPWVFIRAGLAEKND
jgi:membrane-associated phospholipid phosphatase